MAGTAAGAAKRAAGRAAAKAPQDRKAPAARAPRVRRPTVAELAETDAPAARIEVAAEVDAEVPDDGSVEVEFLGETFLIHSPGDWRQSAQEALSNGLFSLWADGAMDVDSARAWRLIDPTNRQCLEFMDAYDEAFRARYGDDPKALQTRLGSSRAMRRRSR